MSKVDGLAVGSKTDLIDLRDELDHCSYKIRFIAETFSARRPGEDFDLSERAISGMYFILAGIEDELNLIGHQMGIFMAEARAGEKAGRQEVDETA